MSEHTPKGPEPVDRGGAPDRTEPEDSAALAFEAALAAEQGVFQLRLYVAGSTPRSQRAIANLKRVCEENLGGRYELEVIDIFQQPELTEGEQILAVPTLIKTIPLPIRRLVGDLSDLRKVLLGLDLRSGRVREGR